jgi:hypothetical protein
MKHSINRKPTLKEVQDAPYSSNLITGNQAWLSIDGVSYVKIERNKWQRYSTIANSMGGMRIVDNDIYEIAKRGKNVKLQWD